MTARTVFNLIAAALQPVVPSGVTVAMGWPTETQLSNIANGSIQPIVSLFDRGPARNRTRWNKVTMTTFPPPEPGVVPVLNNTGLPIGGVVTLTLGGTLLVNDAVAVVFTLGSDQEGQVVVAGSTDTLSTLAASLASAVNANPAMNTWVTASATGPVVTFTSIAPAGMKVGTGAANQGSETIEVRRWLRDIQVIVWTNDVTQRDTISDPIVNLLSVLSSNFGLQDPVSLQWVRVIANGDLYSDDPVLSNLYRRDIMTYAEYGETITDGLYPVLVAKATLQPSV